METQIFNEVGGRLICATLLGLALDPHDACGAWPNLYIGQN
jgi:hypothetical protein